MHIVWYYLHRAKNSSVTSTQIVNLSINNTIHTTEVQTYHICNVYHTYLLLALFFSWRAWWWCSRCQVWAATATSSIGAALHYWSSRMRGVVSMCFLRRPYAHKCICVCEGQKQILWGQSLKFYPWGPILLGRGHVKNQTVQQINAVGSEPSGPRMSLRVPSWDR